MVVNFFGSGAVNVGSIVLSKAYVDILCKKNYSEDKRLCG